MSLLVDFVLPALLVSVFALAALRLAPSAPPGLRLALAAIGLGAWLLPWPAIRVPLEASIVPGLAWLDAGKEQLAAMHQALAATTEAAAPAIGSPSASWLLVFLPGLLWFAAEVSVHRRTLGRWRRLSRSGGALARFLPPELSGPSIRVVPDSAIVVAAGLLRPTIYIGDRIVDDDALRAALTHEACHLRRRDPLWLMLITLVARLYCFNPVVLALKREAVLAIEAGCDEACARRLGRPQYRRTLARLMLEREVPQAPALAPSLQTRGLNVRRLGLLGRVPRFDGRSLGSLLLVVGAGTGALAWGSPFPMRPWLGDWIEVAEPWHWGYQLAPPVSRSFERTGGGLTRISATDASLGASADFRCDGQSYPIAAAAGEPNLSLVCTAIDPWTHRYLVQRADGSGLVAETTETISRDGETMDLRIRQLVAGRTTETARTLLRLR